MNHRSVSLESVVERRPLWSSTGEFPTKLPWDDPAFSQRMLAEHLDQGHDRASRRLETIASHVDWILDEVLDNRPGRVLDLGCGPGLYTAELATRGCTCHGIDFSPAAIEHARKTASERDLDCTYLLADLTSADLGIGYDLVILVFGEFNTFDRHTTALLARRVWHALRPGGLLLLEAHTHAFVVESGISPPTWYSSRGGLFSPRPHIVLTEQEFNEQSAVTRTRYVIIDAETGATQICGEDLAAYTEDQYRQLLTDSGFTEVAFSPGMGEVVDGDMLVISAAKPGAASSRPFAEGGSDD